MKTVIVVSGGDAPGINTVVSNYINMSHHHGDSVVGVQGGFAGLLSDAIVPIDTRAIRLLAGQGGGYLASSRDPVLAAPDAKARLWAQFKKHAIDNMLLFGGDGTLRHVLPLMHEWGIPCIALPTTIDNDVVGTDYTLGHDSACNFAYHAIEGILATAHALPGRIFMVETLGGDTGYLALEIAYAAGAQIALLPEYEDDTTLNWLADRLKTVIDLDGYALVVLSEGMKLIPQLPEAIPHLTGIRLRYTKLGHAQRGGTVSHYDRKLAMQMSQIAHAAFTQGDIGGSIVVRSGDPQLIEKSDHTGKKAPPDYERYAFINRLP